ncbi:glycine zipper 2TM domain-containing protein [Pseudothauera lacus]|uniref:Glycine zipper 2TM domain-containing protein n=1 Tax=Pseudothauera lacus TaxID=2136175 RepID=A0A2T4IDB4_9RHOO|nr:glycine zipper 2TM domain-containing protein [Pseudothauera lacus]PTD95761.1 hypothetical protein C8261_12210 [Pseudothauera lacus]
MNRIRLALALSLAGLASAACASGPMRGQHHDGSYQDWARVTQVQPQYERVRVTRQECGPAHVYYDDHPVHGGGERQLGGAIIGGIAGGIIGNQVGKGNGRHVATAAGAAVGAIVGDRIQNNSAHAVPPQAHGRPRQQCRTVEHWEQQLTGYRVSYEYNGRHYTRFMTHDPGRRLRVNVSVSPA